MPEKSKLDASLAALRKQYGGDVVMRMGDQPREDVPVLPTGSLALDRATGIGGYPRGRIVEVYGPEASGKTTLALHAIANAQRLGGEAAIVDAEHALDRDYAGVIGVDVDRLILSQPDFGEQALDVVEGLVEAGVDIVVVDSVAALTPKAEIEGDFGAPTMGMHARLMSQAMRKLCAKVHQTGTVLFFINQIRHKIGVMFGSPETTTGGNALKFYASMRLDVRKREPVKKAGGAKPGEDKGVQVGNETEVKVVKNKLAPPFQHCKFDILWGRGIDRVGEALQLAADLGAAELTGSWYSFGGHRIAQGFDNAREALMRDALSGGHVFRDLEAATRIALDAERKGARP